MQQPTIPLSAQPIQILVFLSPTLVLLLRVHLRCLLPLWHFRWAPIQCSRDPRPASSSLVIQPILTFWALSDFFMIYLLPLSPKVSSLLPRIPLGSLPWMTKSKPYDIIILGIWFLVPPIPTFWDLNGFFRPNNYPMGPLSVSKPVLLPKVICNCLILTTLTLSTLLSKFPLFVLCFLLS